MARLALSDDDAQVRRWFAEETQKLGCNLVVDQMGNMFANKRGSAQEPTPMIAMGSHLDTQPRGGRYDGILGVVAAVEVMRTLAENGHKTHHNVGIVNWTKYVLLPALLPCLLQLLSYFIVSFPLVFVAHRLIQLHQQRRRR